MKLETTREKFLKPLQQVAGVVERRQTMPVLSNVLTVAREQELILTATDTEVELSARTELPVTEPGEITLSANKLLDILRALPDKAAVSLTVEDGKAYIRCGRSRFVLATLPAVEFPTLEDLPFDGSLRLPQRALRMVIERTHFAMSMNDVRYYLNGLLLDVGENRLRAVATNGHRLALCDTDAAIEPDGWQQQVIVPSKGVKELMRLLGDTDADVRLHLGTNHVQATLDDIRFTSKLIDGRFPDYQRVIPSEGDYLIIADRLALCAALNRVNILSGDKYPRVYLQMSNSLLHLQAHNPEQEMAEEDVEVNYQGEALEIGFNAIYLLNALNAIPGELVKLSFTDANSSCLLQEPEGGRCKYVVMPMRL